MNIVDVAQAAGVSKTTVSRVLSNSKQVKESTKQQVRRVIEELGYTPNTSAQTLAGAKNYVIGIINDIQISDPFYGYIDDLLAEECNKRGYGVVYAVAQSAENGCGKEIAMLYGKVDGFIFTGDDSDHEHSYKEDICKLTQLGIPVALLKTGIQMDHSLSVDVDNKFGGFQAANFILDRKYKRIGYMHGGIDGSFHEGTEREKGFIKAIKQRNSSIFRDYYCNRLYMTAYDNAKDIVESGIDVLFCETDLMAYGAIQGILDLGYSIPKDIAILGYDNFKFRNYQTKIELSTIAQPLEAMASYIVGELIGKIKESQSFENEIKLFDTYVVEGKTV